MIPDANSAWAFIQAATACKRLLWLLKKQEAGDAELDGMDTEVRRLGPLMNEAQKGLDEEKRLNISVPKVHSRVHFR